MSKEDDSNPNKIDVIEEGEAEGCDHDHEHMLNDDQIAAIMEAGETMIEAAHEVVDEIGGTELDVMQLLAMGIGLYCGRAGVPRGYMIDTVLDWYDQGLEEDELMIDVELEKKDDKGVN